MTGNEPTGALAMFALLKSHYPENEIAMRLAFLLGLEHAQTLFGPTGHARFDIRREIARLESAFGQNLPTVEELRLKEDV